MATDNLRFLLGKASVDTLTEEERHRWEKAQGFVKILKMRWGRFNTADAVAAIFDW